MWQRGKISHGGRAARKQHEAMRQRLAEAGVGSPAPAGATDGRAVVVQMPLTPSPEPAGPCSRLQLLTPLEALPQVTLTAGTRVRSR